MEDTDFYLSKGGNHYNLGEYLLAIDAFNAALELDPKQINAYFLRAQAYKELANYREAIQDFNTTILLAPEKSLPYYMRGSIYNLLGEYQKAVVDFDEALLKDSELTSVYKIRGASYSFLGKYQEAIQDFNEYLKLYPQDETAYQIRGYAYLSLNQYENAILDCNVVLSLNPNNEIACYNRAQAYLESGRYQEAIQYFTQVLDLNPYDAEAYVHRGQAELGLWQYHEVVHDATAAIKLDDQNAEAYGLLGFAQANLNQFQEAIQNFNISIKLNPQDYRFFLNRATAYHQLGQFLEAIIDYNTALTLNPQVDTIYNNRGVVYFKLGEYWKAIQDDNIALTLNPHYAECYHNRGMSHAMLGHFWEAINDYTQAINLDSQSALAYHDRGRAYADIASYQKAIADFDKAIELDSQFLSAYYRRGDAYAKAKQDQNAWSNYVRFVFMAKEYLYNTHSLLTFLEDYQIAPFLTIQILRFDPNPEYYHFFYDYLQQVDLQSRATNAFLDYLQLKHCEVKNPTQYWQLNALCYYFMGNPAEAFRIFDEELDQKHPMTLFSHYYYVQSAIHSAIPESSIKLLQEDALRAIDSVLAAEVPADHLELYYAGLIFYQFGGELQKADSCFQRAKEFLPALYIRWHLVDSAQKVLLQKEIIKREDQLPSENQYFQAVPRPLGREAEAFWNVMQHYCFYQEIQPAIKGVHAQIKPLKVTAFYDYWQFRLTEEEQIEVDAYKKALLADKILSTIGKAIEELAGKIDHQQLEYALKRSITEIMREFENLQQDAQKYNSVELERRLASYIYQTAKLSIIEQLHLAGFGFQEVHLKFAVYFMLIGKISARSTVNLLLYSIYTANRFNPKLLTVMHREGRTEGIVDQMKDLAKENIQAIDTQPIKMLLVQNASLAFLLTWGGQLSSYLISYCVKALWTLLTETLLKPEKNLNAGDDYDRFKNDLNEQLQLVGETDGSDLGVEQILGL